MKIVIYTNREEEKLKRLTLEYCQKWNCYPMIEIYKEKDELLKVLKDKDIEILLLAEGKEQDEETIQESGYKEWDTKIIKINAESAKEGIQGSIIQKIEHDIFLAEQIARGLSRCGIPSSNASLCRVHLKTVK